MSQRLQGYSSGQASYQGLKFCYRCSISTIDGSGGSNVSSLFVVIGLAQFRECECCKSYRTSPTQSFRLYQHIQDRKQPFDHQSDTKSSSTGTSDQSSQYSSRQPSKGKTEQHIFQYHRKRDSNRWLSPYELGGKALRAGRKSEPIF